MANGIPGDEPLKNAVRQYRAYHKATGKTLWEIDLGVQATGTPMTYIHNEKQYIVVATKDADHPASLIALSLP